MKIAETAWPYSFRAAATAELAATAPAPIKEQQVVVIDFFAAFSPATAVAFRKEILSTLDDAISAGHRVVVSILREEKELEEMAGLSLRMLFPDYEERRARLMNGGKLLVPHAAIMPGEDGVLGQPGADIYLDNSDNHWKIPCGTYIQIQKDGALPELRRALGLQPAGSAPAAAPAPLPPG